MALGESSAPLGLIEEALPRLCEMLLKERGLVEEVPPTPAQQWDLFRALVNTRPPIPASDGFIELQDSLLQAILEFRGIVSLEDIDPIGCDERLWLWRGDITTIATDAIVNAANSQMLGCFLPGHHCIDNAIHTFAGIQLRLECARLMEAQGYPEPTGMAKVTEAFNLPSRHVIHTVGPIAGGYATESDKALLSNCYTACLDAAEDAGCKSIAFCCISTGVFGFPQDEAASIAVGTVERWLDSHESDMKVVFNVFSERDFGLYDSLLGGQCD